MQKLPDTSVCFPTVKENRRNPHNDQRVHAPIVERLDRSRVNQMACRQPRSMAAQIGRRMMTIEPHSTFGDVLRRVRIAAGLTQEALAERAGLSVRGISDLERGVNRLPRKDTIALLVGALQPKGDDGAAFAAAAGGRGPRPAARSVGSRPQANLPRPLTALIGRATDVAAVTEILGRPDVRLVTLTGTGGVGKTRLAIQVASNHLYSFSDGVCFVGLATLSDSGSVITAIAQQLDLPDTGNRTQDERLIAYLRPKDLLLVLDNFEHLISAAKQVADLLGACPLLRVLITSRAPLHVTGELEFVVSPLAVPDLQHLPESDDLARYPAVGLFLERAQAVNPEFQLSATNSAAVATICAQLDGLPLAIELAASRIRFLPPVAMVARLEQRLQFLTGGARDLPARQQTLRDTITWSYDLLRPHEQRLFRCLAVFSGGWTLEAAEAVCSPSRGTERSFDTSHPSTDDSILDGLAVLVDNNLVRVISESDGTPRFMMLETVGEYAREQLAASGDESAWRLRHAEVFLALAEQLEVNLRGSERLVWRDRLVSDVDNLRASVNWAIVRGEVSLAMRFTAVLYWPWLQIGQFREGRQWSEAALALPGGTERNVDRARTLLAAGAFAWHLGEPIAAHQRLTEAAGLSAELGDRQGLGLAAQFLGLLALSQGDYATAHAQLVESVALFEAISDEWNLANALFILGDAVASQDLEGAHSLYQDSLARFRRLGDPWGIAWPLTGLGGIAMHRGEYAKARALFEEGLALRRQLRDRWGVAISLTSLGEAARSDGDIVGAATFLEDGLALFREVGDQERVAWALHALGCVAEVLGSTADAGACFSESLSLRQEQEHRQGMASSLAGLARIAVRIGATERAVRFLAAADALHDAAGISVAPDEREDHDRLQAMLGAELGQLEFSASWEQSRALPIEQVIAEALVWVDCGRVVPPSSG